MKLVGVRGAVSFLFFPIIDTFVTTAVSQVCHIYLTSEDSLLSTAEPNYNTFCIAYDK